MKYGIYYLVIFASLYFLGERINYYFSSNKNEDFKSIELKPLDFTELLHSPPLILNNGSISHQIEIISRNNIPSEKKKELNLTSHFDLKHFHTVRTELCYDWATFMKLIPSIPINFEYFSWEKRLSLANDIMTSYHNPPISRINNFILKLTGNTSYCVLPRTFDKYDIYLLLHFRYIENLSLREQLTEDEIKLLAQKDNLIKGEIIPYTTEFPHSRHYDKESFYFRYNHSYIDPCFLRDISLKYDYYCGDANLPSRYISNVLIVAVQRAGTHYSWEMLNRLGIDLHHEGVGRDGSVSWPYSVNALSLPIQKVSGIISLFGLYVINNPVPLTRQRFKYVFHQVRHPLRVINTLMKRCYNWDLYWEWISLLFGFEAINKRESPLRRSMLLYLYWNRHIELYAERRFRMETTNIRDLCLWLGYSKDEYCDRELKPIAHLKVQKNSQDTRKKQINYRRQLTPEKGSQSSNLRTLYDKRKTMKTGKYWKIEAREPNKFYKPIDWKDLDKEDLSLSNQLKIMCIEYGYPLDPSLVPQEEGSHQFTA